MRRELSMALVTLALPALAAAQQASSPAAAAPPTRNVEARADEELKKMSAFLAKVPRFALEAEETFDEVADGEPKQELTNVRRVVIERPNHLAADATGDTLNRASWYDGKNLTVLDKERNVYAVIEAPPTIDATLDKIQDEYGVVLPLADLLYADPYAVLMEGVTYGRYLGIHQAAGVSCHHLVFSQDTIEWQIWIDAGAEPMPRKLVINYVDEPGEPQYSATIRRVTTDPKVPEDIFTFEAPEGAQKIEAKAIKRRDVEETKPADAAPKGGQ